MHGKSDAHIYIYYLLTAAAGFIYDASCFTLPSQYYLPLGGQRE